MTKEENNKPCCKGSTASFFFGIALLIWGASILLDNYFQLDLASNLFPMFVIVLGSFLIVTGFNR